MRPLDLHLTTMRVVCLGAVALLFLSVPGLAGAIHPAPGDQGVPFCGGAKCGWSYAKIPSNLPYEVVLKDVVYVNSTIVVVVGWQGTLLRSTDSGKDWVQLHSPIPNDAYNAVVSIPGAGLLLAGGNNGSLIASPSEGASWLVYPSTGLQGTINEMGFTSGSFGYAATTAGLFVTTDGAQNWTDVKVPGSGTVYAASFSTLSSGWINVGVSAEMYRTTDGGRSWTLLHMGFAPVFVSNIVAQGPSTAWVLGDHGNVWRTSDGGNFTNSTLPTGQKTWQLAALGSSAWVVSDDANTFYTNNDGQCWVEESVPSIPELYAVTFTNPLDGVAAGDGVIWYTTDAGLGGNDSSSCPKTPGSTNVLGFVTVLSILVAALLAGIFYVRARKGPVPDGPETQPSPKAITEARRRLRYRERKRYVRR